MARISYVDPATISDPELLEALEASRRPDAAGPQTHLIRSHVPAVAKAVSRSGELLFRQGRVDHAVKELCRLYIAETVRCEF